MDDGYEKILFRLLLRHRRWIERGCSLDFFGWVCFFWVQNLPEHVVVVVDARKEFELSFSDENRMKEGFQEGDQEKTSNVQKSLFSKVFFCQLQRKRQSLDNSVDQTCFEANSNLNSNKKLQKSLLNLSNSTTSSIQILHHFHYCHLSTTPEVASQRKNNSRISILLNKNSNSSTIYQLKNGSSESCVILISHTISKRGVPPQFAQIRGSSQ
jgi:hypothetical protein